MQYLGRFVPSISQGVPAGDWERFYNAEVPAHMLKARASNRVSLFHAEELKKFDNHELREFPDADGSAAMLIWRGRNMPEPDREPDEVWHLTDRFGLIRTPWSAIIEPIESDEISEPTLANHEQSEEEVVDWAEVESPDLLWRPPTPEVLAQRKIYLEGDRRPLKEDRRSKGLRRACEECGVVPHIDTQACRCTIHEGFPRRLSPLTAPRDTPAREFAVSERARMRALAKKTLYAQGILRPTDHQVDTMLAFFESNMQKAEYARGE